MERVTSREQNTPQRAMQGQVIPPPYQLVFHADVHLPVALRFRPAVDHERHLRLVRGVQAPAEHANLSWAISRRVERIIRTPVLEANCEIKRFERVRVKAAGAADKGKP